MNIDLTAAALASQEQQNMHEILQKIATGPHLSKDITLEQAQSATVDILQGKIDPVRAAMFFIALRMKRESMDENKGILGGIISCTRRATAEVSQLVDLADPYNGYNRTLPVSPFVPVLLASCGVNCYSHGVLSLSPKFGVTHKQVLQAGGIDTDLTPAAAAKKIEEQGWAYVDQAEHCPELHELRDFRTLIIKRLALNACEVLSGPIRATGQTHLVTGFVHKAYPEIYAELARFAGFDSALLVKGVEGGIIPTLRQKVSCYYHHEQQKEQETIMNPDDFGIAQEARAEIPADKQNIAQAAFDAGLAALSGTKGLSYDALVYASAMILVHIGKFDSRLDAANRVREVLNSGQAKERLLDG